MNFDRNFPELYPWHSQDSRLGSAVGEAIAKAIKKDLEDYRLRVPGLRTALCILWDELQRKD